MPTDQAPVRPLLAVGVAAAAVRVAYTLVVAQHVELGISDATFYSGAANHLARGDGFVDIWRCSCTSCWSRCPWR